MTSYSPEGVYLEVDGVQVELTDAYIEFEKIVPDQNKTEGQWISEVKAACERLGWKGLSGSAAIDVAARVSAQYHEYVKKKFSPQTSPSITDSTPTNSRPSEETISQPTSPVS